MQPVKLPDLIIAQVSWSYPPKDGDTLGTSAILNILVQNRGNAPAGANNLRIECKSLTGTNYPYPLDGMINVQPLDSGQSVTYPWPHASSEKWFPGTYKLDLTIDYLSNLVKESNENNNKKSLIFTVSPKPDFRKNLKVTPPVTPQLKTDLEVVSISISPGNPTSSQTVSVTAVIKNSGNANTPQVNSQVTFFNTNGGPMFYAAAPSVPPLNPGQTWELKTSTPIITLGKNAGISVKIDRFNTFKEINEANNEKLFNFNVQCKPELAPYDYTKPKPVSLHGETKPGEIFSTTIWVYNNGGCPSKPGTLIVQGPGLSPTSYNIPSIIGNQKAGVQISQTWAQAGVKNCEVIVDYTNTNDESIENNNRLPLRISVLGEWHN